MQRNRLFRTNWQLLIIGAMVVMAAMVAPTRGRAQDPLPDWAVTDINGEPIPREAFHARVRLVRWQYLHELEALYEATGGNFGLTPDYVTNLVTSLQDPLVLGDAVLAEMEQERLLWQTGESLEVTPTAEDAVLREALFFSAWTDVSLEMLEEKKPKKSLIAL